MSVKVPKQKPAAGARLQTPPAAKKQKAPDKRNAALTDNQWVLGAVLILITFILYRPALRTDFIWDDDTHLTTNLLIEKNGLWRSWFTTEQPNYWPVTWTAFWIQWKLFGLKPFGFHLVNVLLHGLNAVLVWRVLKRLAIPGAWTAALIFAVHPVNVETAAWVTQLKTLLAMGFYLTSLHCFLRSEEEKAPRWYAVSVPLFLVAMLSKPSVVTMPLVLLLIAWWRRGGITRTDLLRSLPFFAIAGFLSVTEIWFQYNRSIQETVVRTDGLLSRLASAGWVIWFYLSKVLLPSNLMFVYPRWEVRAASPLHWLPLLALAALGGILWKARSSWGRPVLFGLGYFVVTLLPVLGFLNIFYMRYSFVADHWQYQSMIGVVALVTGAAVHLARTRFAARPALLPVGAALVVAVLAAVTWKHQGMYTSADHLWRETLKQNPRAWIAHQCLGESLARQGRMDEAMAHFSKELEIKPDFAEPHYNLGIALASQGREEEALKHYERAMELDPRFVAAHNNAGALLASQGRFDEAVEKYTEALRVRPGFAEVHVNWGLALAQQKKYDEAIGHYAEAVRLSPRNTTARTNWASALMAQGNQTAAVELLAEVVAMDPASPDAHLNLARAQSAAGRLQDAIRSCQTALQLDPNSGKARQLLGNLQLRMKR